MVGVVLAALEVVDGLLERLVDERELGLGIDLGDEWCLRIGGHSGEEVGQLDHVAIAIDDPAMFGIGHESGLHQRWTRGMGGHQRVTPSFSKLRRQQEQHMNRFVECQRPKPMVQINRLEV